MRFGLDIPQYAPSTTRKGRVNQEFDAVFDVFRVDMGGLTGIACAKVGWPEFSASKSFNTRERATYLIRVAAQDGEKPGNFLYRLGKPQSVPRGSGKLVRKWSVHGAVNSVTHRYDLWGRKLRRGVHYVLGIRDGSGTLGVMTAGPGQSLSGRSSGLNFGGPEPGLVFKAEKTGRYRFLVGAESSSAANRPYALAARKARKDDYAPGIRWRGRAVGGMVGWNGYDPWDIYRLHLPRRGYIRFLTHSKQALDIDLHKSSGASIFLGCVYHCPDDNPGDNSIGTTEPLEAGTYRVVITSYDESVRYRVRWRWAKGPPALYAD